MNRKTSKIFSAFWLLSGLLWLIALIRHSLVNQDTIGFLIYAFASLLSFVLAFAYYKNLVK